MERPTIVVSGFRTTYEKNPATGAMDRPVDWVTFAPAHMAMFTQIEERVDWMRPDNIKGGGIDQDGKKADFMRWRWQMIEPAYNAWKQGHEIPVNGTPIGVWPGLNQAQVQAFIAAGMRSVEDVATMTDGALSRVPLPNLRDLKKQAQAFLDARGDAAVADRLAQAERKQEELQEQLTAALAMLERDKKADASKHKGREAA